MGKSRYLEVYCAILTYIQQFKLNPFNNYFFNGYKHYFFKFYWIIYIFGPV